MKLNKCLFFGLFLVFLLCFSICSVSASSNNDSSMNFSDDSFSQDNQHIIDEITEEHKYTNKNNEETFNNEFKENSDNNYKLDYGYTHKDINFVDNDGYVLNNYQDSIISYENTSYNQNINNNLNINDSNTNNIFIKNQTSNNNIYLNQESITLESKYSDYQNNDTLNNNTVYSVDDLINSTDYVNSFIINNESLPQEVSINMDNITLDDYVYYICLIGTSNTTTSHFNNISFYNNSQNTTVTSEEINNIALNLATYYETNNQMPTQITTINNNTFNMLEITQLLLNSIKNINTSIQLVSTTSLRNITVTVNNYNELYKTINRNDYSSLTVKLSGNKTYYVNKLIMCAGDNSRNITIIGNNHTLSGSNAPFLYVDQRCKFILQNITLTNYTLNATIIENQGILNIKNCNLRNNLAVMGGVICNYGTLLLEKNVITNNKASYGGVIFNLGKSTLKFNSISNNKAYENATFYSGLGGIIFLNNGTVSLFNNTIYSNSAIRGSVLYIDETYVADNSMCTDSSFICNSRYAFT